MPFMCLHLTPVGSDLRYGASPSTCDHCGHSLSLGIATDVRLPAGSSRYPLRVRVPVSLPQAHHLGNTADRLLPEPWLMSIEDCSMPSGRLRQRRVSAFADITSAWCLVCADYWIGLDAHCPAMTTGGVEVEQVPCGSLESLPNAPAMGDYEGRRYKTSVMPLLLTRSCSARVRQGEPLH